MDEEMANVEHPRHKEYQMYGCDCEYHIQAQEDDINWQRTDPNHPYHETFYPCGIDNCAYCETEDEENKESSSSQDVGNSEHLNHNVIH